MSTVKVDTLETLDGSLSAQVAEIIARMGVVGGTSAGHDVQVAPSDDVAGRILAVGAFGLGGASIPMGTTSLDDLITRGCQFVWVSTVNAATCNAPSGASGGVCLHVSLSSTSAKQTYFQTVTADRTWTRYYQSGVWTVWVEMWHDRGVNTIKVDTGAVGYSTGAGGVVTQLTSKSTAVTLNKPTGQITLNGAALAANTPVSFALNNTKITAGDSIILNILSGTAGAYYVNTSGITNNSATISVQNMSAASLSEAIVIQFTIIRGANS